MILNNYVIEGAREHILFAMDEEHRLKDLQGYLRHRIEDEIKKELIMNENRNFIVWIEQEKTWIDEDTPVIRDILCLKIATKEDLTEGEIRGIEGLLEGQLIKDEFCEKFRVEGRIIYAFHKYMFEMG